MTKPADMRVVVLAAGASRRFGADDKLLADVAGRPLLARTLVEVLRHVRADRVEVVVPPDEPARVAIAQARGASVVIAPEARSGMRHSLLAALEARSQDEHGVVVVLGDDPLTARALPDVLRAAAVEPDRVVAVRRSPPVPHPVHLPRPVWGAVRDALELGGTHDSGLRDLLRDGDVVWCDGPARRPVDVDEPADVARLAAVVAAPDVVASDQLILRRWRVEDRPSFARMNADPRVAEHLPNTLDRAGSDALLDRIEEQFDEHGFGLWAVVPGADADTEPVGWTGLAVPRFEAHFTPSVEIGWRLAPEAWGRGYATEAARAAMRDAATRCDLRELVSFTVPANVRSIAVMERLGMTHDPQDDFHHPLVERGSRLEHHVLYRLALQSVAG